MKLPSFLKFTASALLVPTAGLAVLHSVSQLNSAQADTISSHTIVSQATTTPAVKKVNRGEMFQQLNLSSEQQAQIKTIREQSKISNQGLRDQMKTAREQLKTLLASSDASEDSIRQAHQQVQSLGQQMGERRFDNMLQIRQVLTPAQRTKLAELHKAGAQNRRNHRGGGEKAAS